MTDAQQSEGPEEAAADELKPIVRDRRRIDPETGARRQSEDTAEPGADAPATGSDPGASSGSGVSSGSGSPSGSATASDGDALAQARAEATERLDDLKRLQAEYVNYRRRVERDRELVRESARAEVLAELLSVLDDVGRAREHGDLTGTFRAVGEALESVTAKAGLVRFGEAGDEFDPTIHEALMHSYADDVEVVTCTQILQPGYRIGERVIRAARVAVAEPTAALSEPADSAVSAEPSPEAAGDNGGADGAE